MGVEDGGDVGPALLEGIPWQVLSFIPEVVRCIEGNWDLQQSCPGGRNGHYNYAAKQNVNDMCISAPVQSKAIQEELATVVNIKHLELRI